MNSNCIIDLRERLLKNLKRLINNPAIEAKELAAFDLIMSRRQFLKAAQFTAIGALAASAYPPTAWGRYDRKLHIHPKDVGLTDGDMAAVTQATQLITGTELFQDTIYAQPVVASEVVGSHALIEGPRGRLRLQTDLLSTNPDEFQFLDAGYHYGPTELIQLENDPSAGWELVHYHYPWSGRSDGARTDGLIRQVIMTENDGLANPTKVIAVTGTNTNRFSTGTTNQVNTFSYLVFVEDTASGTPGHIVIGTGVANVPPPYNSLPVYPVRWVSNKLDTNIIGSYTTYQFADKYTHNSFTYPVAYDPVRATEHVILYFEDRIKILSLVDTYIEGSFTIVPVATLPNPANVSKPRVAHIDFDPGVEASSGAYQFSNVALASSYNYSDGGIQYATHSMNQNGNTNFAKGFFLSPNIIIQWIDWSDAYHTYTLQVPASDLQGGDLALDYSMLSDVHSLYYFSTPPGPDGTIGYYHVKLANFVDRGLFALVYEGSAAPEANSTPYTLMGHFPFAFPEAVGLGEILSFSGGVSKFGGFRFVASDADGNTFILRQRRLSPSDSPYPGPIYGQFNADGTPRTTFSTTQDALPPATASGSNLHDLASWVAASSLGGLSGTYAYNALLSLALAFATDDTSSSQAVWLGNAYKAAYAVSRFGLDAGFVAIRLAQGSTDSYAAYHVLQNQVDKTWRQRLIATQIIPQGPGLQEMGDHYQATVTPANAYGKPVSLLSDENANLLIEVRADSPCTVIDDTNNLYYDVDRYTSFMAAPDPATARLSLLVKAETFSQVLYVRLVDTSGLQPSNDAAMLSATGVATYNWQSVNLALQAQQRMGNGAPASSLLGDNMPLADTTVYISGDTLAQSNPDTPWKGDYTPTTDNLGNLAVYLNTSGQNLISATGQLSLGAAADGVTIDPLYAVTAVPVDSSRATVTTQFAYNTGSVNISQSAPFSMPNGQLGSLWSSISHALHDALQWLQHVEGDVYKDLASGGVSIVSAVDSITVTVGKDIMKQVNGVEQELNEVVSTVEEYASLVANLVVTIVESTYLYKFIETLITLISLFLHFKDVLSLSNSFKGLFDDILSGSNGESIPQIPSSFSSWDTARGYLGSGNTFSQAFGGVDPSNVGSELIQGVLDAILGNPLTKKILNKIMSALSSLLNEALPTPPLSFDMDQSAAQGIMDDIKNLVDNLEQGVAQMTEQTATVLIQQLAADAADPQQTYRNLGSGLGSLAEEIASDFITPVFDFVDEVTTGAPAYARDMIDYSPYITFDTAVLADLCKLFGIGSVSNTKLTLKASEAVFFPLALIAWVAVYTHDGRSVSSVDELNDEFLTASGEVGASGATLWNLVRLAADGALTEFGGFVWFLAAAASKKGSTSTAVKSIAHAGAWLNWIRWMSDFVYTCRNWDPATGRSWDYANVAIRLTTASADLVFTLPDLNLNPGAGWPTSPRPTDMSQVINVLVTLVSMGADTYWVAESNPDTNQIISIAGQDFARSQGIATFLYNLFSLKDYLAYFTAYVLVCPFGFEMQVLALSGVLESPGQPGTRPGKHHRRRRRNQPRRRPKNRVRRVGR